MYCLVQCFGIIGDGIELVSIIDSMKRKINRLRSINQQARTQRESHKDSLESTRIYHLQVLKQTQLKIRKAEL